MQDPVFVQNAFARIARRYVLTNHVLSLGTDVLWRRRVAEVVRRFAPARLLDLATGTGDLALSIAKACPETRITGVDFSEPMLDIARKRGIPRTEWLIADALHLPFPDASFDAVTVAFGLRNMASWPDALRGMARVLRPGGLLVILDFSLPSGRLLRGPHRFYLTRVLPRIAGILTGERGAYEYLATSIREFPSGHAMLRLVESCGFSDSRCRALTGGVASLYSALRSGNDG